MSLAYIEACEVDHTLNVRQGQDANLRRELLRLRAEDAEEVVKEEEEEERDVRSATCGIALGPIQLQPQHTEPAVDCR